MRTLTIGSRGKLGSELAKYTTSSYGGYLRSEDEIRSLVERERPDVIINCAGYTNVDKAEQEPRKCIDANLGLVMDLTRVCADMDLYLVHISTAFVFDDVINISDKAEFDANYINPSLTDGVYRVSKLYAELEMNRFIESWAGCVIRTCGLFGVEGDSLASYILQSALNGKQVRLNTLRQQNYTYIPWLAQHIYDIVQTEEFAGQYYHLVSRDHCSPYIFGKTLLDAFDMKEEVILAPVDRWTGRDYIRPINCALSPSYQSPSIEQFIEMYREDIS